MEILEYYRCVDHAIDIFSRYFGPTSRTLKLIEPERQESFRDDLRTVLERYNVANDGTLALKASYLRTIAIKK